MEGGLVMWRMGEKGEDGREEGKEIEKVGMNVMTQAEKVALG
jgi:hypothetical protein